MNVNRVTVSGRITRDAELRQTTSGTTVVQFGICANDRRQVNGEWTDVPNFFDCAMFGARAQALHDRGHLRKGAWVLLDGKLHYRSWEDQSGAKRSKVEITVDNVDFPPAARTEPQNVPQTQQPPTPPMDTAALFSEDVPF